jgi:hypothetical protein
MCSVISEHLSGKPAGTILNAQMANTCVPEDERPNKMPIFISGFSDTLAFLGLLRHPTSARRPN